MFYNGHIVNPDRYLTPSYKLSPFSNADIAKNSEMSETSLLTDYLVSHYEGLTACLTTNGRSALNCALRQLSLKSEDVVTIITTTQNFYISGCVTNEIEKFCTWNREISDRTTIILVNHEFGFPMYNVESLKRYHVPIIEDCAYAFNAQHDNSLVGKTGDFVIYSLPKFFPIQIGGILVSRNPLPHNCELLRSEEEYINRVAGSYVSDISSFSDLRRFNYNYLKNEFAKLGLGARFGELKDNDIPGVFMFSFPSEIDSDKLKTFFYANGVECSVFYGESALFIPCHHKINKGDMNYFVSIMDYFLKHMII